MLIKTDDNPFKMLDEAEARLKRMRVLVNQIDILSETEKDSPELDALIKPIMRDMLEVSTEIAINMLTPTLCSIMASVGMDAGRSYLKSVVADTHRSAMTLLGEAAAGNPELARIMIDMLAKDLAAASKADKQAAKPAAATTAPAAETAPGDAGATRQ